jgi:hypothetical protein
MTKSARSTVFFGDLDPRRFVGRIALAFTLGAPIGLCLAAFPTQVASAATLTVTNCNGSGAGSLRQTVAGAASGDTITFDLSPACPTITLTSGVIDIATNLTVDGPGANVLAVSGNNASPVFDVAKTFTFVISGLTIENGLAGGHEFTKSGGGIVNSGTLSVTDSTFSNNKADIGAGIANGGTLNVTDSTFSNNNSTERGGGSGGGISNSGTATLTGSTMWSNKSGSGGAVYNTGTMTIHDTTIWGNFAPSGGGIATGPGTLTMTDSTVSDNTSYESGGINNAGTGTDTAILNIADSTVSGNSTSGGGGGIGNGFGGTVTLANSTVSGNTARSDGGGISNSGSPGDEGTVTVTNSTVVGNTSTDHGGGGVSNYQGTVTLEATIVADSSGIDCLGVVDDGYNIDDDGSCGFTAPSVSDSPALDSTLGPLAANGGPTKTIALLPGSPAIDKVPAPDCPATDQRGAIRAAPCDMGAYDTDGTLTVTNCNDSGTGSLRNAVTSAAPQDEISFALSPACPTIALTSGPIAITTSLSIEGPGPGVLAVSGNQTSQIFVVGDDTVTIAGLTLEDGQSPDANGGAIANDGGTLTVSNSTISDNATCDGGGGIWNDQGTLTVTDSTLWGNTACDTGGGIWNDGGISSVDATTVAGNGADSGGGGIENSGALTVANSTFSANEASDGGGIENAASATLIVTNSTLAQNVASGTGGDISNLEGTATVTASIVAESKTAGGDCAGTITDDGYNVDDDGTCGFAAPSISDSSTLDGTLGALTNNGGPTQTIALLPGSPAIDKVPVTDCPATDQRGISRTAPCDIGAYDTDGTPAIAKVTPALGKVGKKVTITGTDLSDATVTFNGTPAVITKDAATKITTTVPSGASSGAVTVSTATGGTATSTQTFKVT